MSGLRQGWVEGGARCGIGLEMVFGRFWVSLGLVQGV